MFGEIWLFLQRKKTKNEKNALRIVISAHIVWWRVPNKKDGAKWHYSQKKLHTTAEIPNDVITNHEVAIWPL